MKQLDFITNPDVSIKVAPSCIEPRIWIRRLVVWASPTEIVRDLQFRRGLNIIWSPDISAGPDARNRPRRRGSGHGAGKTLTCRLIRYCLGEERFAGHELYDAIRVALPEGLVGAEVVIDRSAWSVVRPIGLGRKTRIAMGVPLEDLLEAPGTGIDPLFNAVRHGVLGFDLLDVIAGTHVGRDWLHALAWISRDQEARYNHLLEWRSTSSGSESPSAGALKTVLEDVARLLVGAMSSDEVACKRKLDSIAVQIARHERDAVFLTRSVTELETEALAAANMENFQGAASLAIPAAMARLRDQLQSLEERMTSDDSAALEPLRRDLESLLAEMGKITGEREKIDSLVDLQNANLNQLKGELTTLSAKELEARLGPYCPICNVAIDRALAEGCGLASRLPDPDRIAAEAETVEQTRRTCEGALKDYRTQLAALRQKEATLETKITDLRARIQQAERDTRQARIALGTQLRAAMRSMNSVERLGRIAARRDDNQSLLRQLDAEQVHLKETLEAHRLASSSVIARWSQFFGYVCAEIYGKDAACRLTLSGNGLQARMPTGGLAMEALKVVAFDLATLLMSIEGQTKLPALLIHDSPREADLGESLFHQIFRLAADLERLCEQPPFQYIISTTSAPPADLEDHVVLRLSSSKVSERLLRREL